MKNCLFVFCLVLCAAIAPGANADSGARREPLHRSANGAVIGGLAGLAVGFGLGHAISNGGETEEAVLMVPLGIVVGVLIGWRYDSRGEEQVREAWSQERQAFQQSLLSQPPVSAREQTSPSSGTLTSAPLARLSLLR